jgi:hypothetical protein
MENKERIPCSLKEVNGFKYLQRGKEKYFVNDIIELDNAVNEDTGKPLKFEIVDIMTSNHITAFNAKSGRSIIPTSQIKSFYYKKDIKKYIHKNSPRIYESPEDKLIVDSYGNSGYIKDMIIVKKKLVVKSMCTKILIDSNEDNGTWILTSEIMSIPHYKCAITDKLYVTHYRAACYEVKLTDNDPYFQTTAKYANKESVKSLLTCNYKILGKAFSPEIIYLLNGEELLKSFPDKFVIGPRSGQIILKSQIMSDGYRAYPSGYYFPEFKNLKKFQPNDNEFNYRWGLDSPTHLITEGLKYTFGVEIEMADCSFNNKLLQDFNIMVEKDGSITNSRREKYGPEIITGILKGDQGLAHLQSLCNELANKGEVNHTCGIHTHIGSADFNNTNLVMLYKLLKHIEDDIFNMLPKSRRENKYCRRLPNLDFNFDGCTTIMDMKIRVDNYYTELFTKAADSPPSDKLNKTKNHPKGAKVQYDQTNIRYCWANFIPALFNTRMTNPPSYTIEFRCFNASTNFTKIKNWLKICMALVNFAENSHSDIMSNTVTLKGEVLPLTLKNVMNKVYPKSYRIINEFIDMRTALFENVETEDIKNENEVNDNLKLKQLI